MLATGKLFYCLLKDWIYIKLSARLYFVLIRANELCYFCSDVTINSSTKKCTQWEWLYKNRNSISALFHKCDKIIVTGQSVTYELFSGHCNVQQIVRSNWANKDEIYESEWSVLLERMADLHAVMNLARGDKKYIPRSSTHALIPHVADNDCHVSGLSDVTFKIQDGRCFTLQKILLIRQSQVFKTMLTSKYWKNSSLPQIDIHEQEECLPYMKEFFLFFYKDDNMKKDMTRENVLPLAILSDKYAVCELNRECKSYMDHVLYSTDVDTVSIWWQRGPNFLTDFDELNAKCKSFLLLNFNKVITSESFLSTPYERLISLLEEDDMVVDNEYVLFEHIREWMKHNDCKEESLLCYIKFWAMSTDQLFSIERDLPPLLLYEAMKYHARDYRLRRFHGLKQARPRFYLNSAVNVPRDNNVITFLIPTCSSHADRLDNKWLKLSYSPGCISREGLVLDRIIIVTDTYNEAEFLDLKILLPSGPHGENQVMIKERVQIYCTPSGHKLFFELSPSAPKAYIMVDQYYSQNHPCFSKEEVVL